MADSIAGRRPRDLEYSLSLLGISTAGCACWSYTALCLALLSAQLVGVLHAGLLYWSTKYMKLMLEA